VVATLNAKVARFGGAPFCDWPGGTALGIYWEATQRDEKLLDRFAPRLRCDEDPVLLARPTPFASVVACVHGLWTPRSERLILLAERVPKIAALRPRVLFPSDLGARRCAIPGPFAQKFHGLCGVYLKRVWSKPVVTFVETWPRRDHRTARHRWRVIVRNGRGSVVSETGPVPPQLWR